VNPENPRVLSQAEIEGLLRQVAGRPMERFVRLALQTGMRPGEIIHLPWSEVDFEVGMIHVRYGGDGATKSRRDRVLPMHRDLRTFLAGLRPRIGLVVPLSKNQVEDWFHDDLRPPDAGGPPIGDREAALPAQGPQVGIGGLNDPQIDCPPGVPGPGIRDCFRRSMFI
jgi:integrase